MIRLSIIALLVLGFQSPITGEEPRALRLLTYNIHAGIGTDRVFDLKRIAAVISKEKPDIVALQEVDRKTKRSKGIDIAEELAKLTGMKSVFGASISFQGGEYGNALLTRLPIESFETIPLPEKVEVEKRSLLSATLRFRDREIEVLATHLCHREEQNRIAAVEAIANLTTKSRSPAFLLGDLNALPDSSPIKILLEAGWRNPSEEPKPTVPAEKPERQIDYVLIRESNELSMSVKEVRVLEEKVASDHRALIVVLEW